MGPKVDVSYFFSVYHYTFSCRSNCASEQIIKNLHLKNIFRISFWGAGSEFGWGVSAYVVDVARAGWPCSTPHRRLHLLHLVNIIIL